MRIATQKYGYTFSPDADFHVLYWRIDGAAWDYDMSPNAEIINPTVEGDRHIIDLADYVSGIDGAIDIAIVAGEGDYSVWDKTNLADFGAEASGTVDFTAPQPATDGAFL